MPNDTVNYNCLKQPVVMNKTMTRPLGSVFVGDKTARVVFLVARTYIRKILIVMTVLLFLLKFKKPMNAWYIRTISRQMRLRSVRE